MPSIMTFLTSLPAILGIIGFAIYLFLKKSVTHDPIIKSIIDKLKFEEPDFENRWIGLNDKQKEAILKDDNALREKISVHDRKILDKALTNQFNTNIFVYSLCALLIIVGIYFFLKPKPLTIDNIIIQNANSKNHDVITDLDPITVTWTSSGIDKEVFIVLENIETGKQTKRMRSQASDGKITFISDKYTNYDKILSNRYPNEENRVRAIIYSNSESFKSIAFEVKVGVKIICYEKKPNKLIFNAIIYQVILENCYFSPRVALFKDEHFNASTIFEATDYNTEPVITIKNPKEYTTSNLVFTINPRDIINMDICRVDVESLREAIKSLQK